MFQYCFSYRFSEEDQKQYRSEIGMLLSLVEHSKPVIANATHELSNVYGGAKNAFYYEMHHVMKYVLDAKIESEI